MKLIFKLILLGILVVAVLPMIAPNSPVSGVIRAATADIVSFCDRRPDACEEGALFVEQTRDALFSLIGSIASSNGPSALTAADRALAPFRQSAEAARDPNAPIKVQVKTFSAAPAGQAGQPAAPTAQDRKAAFAGHGSSFSY